MKENKKILNKTKLIKLTSKNLNQRQTIVTLIIEEFLSQITKAFSDNDYVLLQNFGTFRKKLYPGFKTRHPQTHVPIEINPKHRVVFIPSKKMKESILQTNRKEVRE